MKSLLKTSRKWDYRSGFWINIQTCPMSKEAKLMADYLKFGG